MSSYFAYDVSGNDNRGKLATTTATQTFELRFTGASTTFPVPLGVTKMMIETWGAGGGGGGQNLASDGGSGGGGGGYSKSVLSVNSGQTYILSIGGGGAGGTGDNGVPGGDSYFADPSGTVLVLACGGEGGDPSTGTPPTTGHDGGQASCGTGQLKYSGGNGGNGENNADGDGSGGGESACTNGNGNAGSVGGTNGGAGGTGCDGGDGGAGGNNGVNGNDGVAPGGGGGGSGEGQPLTGGAGADGQIKLTYDIPDPARTAGKIGQALEFDGVDDYVDAGGAASLTNLQTFSQSVWIYPKGWGVNSAGVIIEKVIALGGAGPDSTRQIRLLNGLGEQSIRTFVQTDATSAQTNAVNNSISLNT